MSFYTSLHFYRPTKPPRVTGPALAEFLRDLSATGLFDRKGAEGLNVKFGRSIDKDARPTTWEVSDRSGWSTFEGIEWDVEHDRISLDDAITLLSSHDRPVYRAGVGLGYLGDGASRLLHVVREDGTQNLALGDCSIRIEPVELCHMHGEGRFAVGWMCVSIGGYGFLHPWTPRDLTDRAAASSELRLVTDVCRRLFPVDPEGTPTVIEKLAPDWRKARVRMIRQKMGDLWPLDDVDAPWDWFWGVAETG